MRLISRLDQSRWLPPGRRIQELPRGNELPITMDAADLQSSRTINPRGPQMITKQTKTTFRRFPRRDQGIGDHDPAQLSALLRELAIRAFRLVRARDRTASEYAGGAECSEKALDEVHGQIVQLQRASRRTWTTWLRTSRPCVSVSRNASTDEGTPTPRIMLD